MVAAEQEDNKDERELEKQRSRDLRQKIIDTQNQVEEGQLLLEYQIQGIEISSKLMYARLRSLVESGFTPEQAYGLIMQRGIM